MTAHEPFLLDDAGNPHPVMLRRALVLRRAARAAAAQHEASIVAFVWMGYRDAMTDATGCKPEDLEAWLDGHDDTFASLPDYVPTVENYDTKVAIRRP
jgi:hypothetical protein